ncbi:MAG: type II toxin-antitoxin system VapC family toxin [Terriglobales bacterium]
MTPRLAYFDTSVLVKRYVREQNSAAARRMLSRFRVVSCALAPLEIVSTLSRRRRAGEVSPDRHQVLVGRLRRDRTHWELVEVGPLVLDRAEEIIERTGLRSLDAVHIASAMVFQQVTRVQIPFATADGQQRQAASLLELELVDLD